MFSRILTALVVGLLCTGFAQADNLNSLKAENTALREDLRSFQMTIEQAQEQLRQLHECEDQYGKSNSKCRPAFEKLEQILVPACND